MEHLSVCRKLEWAGLRQNCSPLVGRIPILERVLFGGLPESVLCGDKEILVYTDFRTWMQVETVLFETEGEFYTKLPELLKLCYPVLPDTLEDAVSGLVQFYLGGEPDEKAGSREKRSRQLYSFCQDAPLIYAAFYQQYGIDLTTANLHWFQFKALFTGLGEETKFARVIGYRAVDASIFKSKEKRQFYHTMKQLYRLKDRRTEAEKEAELQSVMEMLF
ncbi:MAG: hypothetical protein E7400_06700 [Ruminococcaceae bacterium]|nr:hypothetical protein [Oscillospiraceae bacterium]